MMEVLVSNHHEIFECLSGEEGSESEDGYFDSNPDLDYRKQLRMMVNQSAKQYNGQHNYKINMVYRLIVEELAREGLEVQSDLLKLTLK
ncbi:hypothetical protein [Vibrio nomapromontoriensis]|uniref:hypothetical protein n=1 Tax=Vibrio nomapromontoriensis TaxID=2910246 RepID=UPI003D10B5D4